MIAIRTKVIALLMSACLVLLAGCTQGKRTLWLDEKDVIIEAEQSHAITFDVGELSEDAKPVLWLAPRMVFMLEAGFSRALVLEVNGTAVKGDRLIAASKTYQRPCIPEWPIRQFDKYEVTPRSEGWTMHLDDDFVIGHVDPTSKWRSYAPENFEPSYAIDLCGLLRRGENRLTIKNQFDIKRVTKRKGWVYPDRPPIPLYAIHARFVRIGLIARDEIDGYNRRHTLPYGPRTRSFNLWDPKGFDDMVRYYSDAAEQAETAEWRAFLNHVHASVLLWKGRAAAAQVLLEKAYAEDTDPERKSKTLFLLGVAQARQGKEGAAEESWDRLAREYPMSPWNQLATREKAVLSWKGNPQPINWPYLQAFRTDAPVVVDGKLDDAVWKRIRPNARLALRDNIYTPFPFKTEIRAAYDDKCFYLSAVCYEPQMDQIKSDATERDSPVWGDDNIELFLDPGRTYVQTFEFELGANGAIVDCHNVWDISFMDYNPLRKDSAVKLADRWIVEMAVPWQSLRTVAPKAGDVWLCNVIRSRPETKTRPGAYGLLGQTTWRFAAHEFAAYLIFR